jgi:hypothetical protein
MIVFAAIAVVASSFLIDPAQGLQLCEEVSDETCREDVDAKIDAAVAALVSSVPVEGDRRSAVNELRKANMQFDLARLEVAAADPSLTEERICSRAGDQDDRALKQITKGVLNAEKIPASKFSSAAGLTAVRTALGALVQVEIDAVSDNADEVEVLTGPLSEIADARKRLFGAESALAQGKLSKAADGGQRAYDVIRDQGNVVTCLDNQ